MSELDPDIRRELEAAEWMARLQEDATANAQIIAWVEWCNSDPENRRVFERLLPLWQGFEAPNAPSPKLAGWLASQPTASKPAGHARLIEFEDRRGMGSPVLPSSARRNGLLAAALVALGLLGALMFSLPRSSTVQLQASATIATRHGENRDGSLPDGSRVHLGGESAITVDYEQSRRQITLTGGEAYFAVQHDAARPFLVRVGSLQVMAVGTAFDVLRTGRRVTVSVSEGTVQIDQSAESGGGALSPRRISGGTQLVVDEDAPLRAVTRTIDPNSADVWRRGRLDFLDEPLDYVVADLNRYARVPIRIADNSTARLHFTGTVDLRLIDEWLRALPGVFPVTIDTDGHSQTIHALSQPSHHD